MRNLELSGVIAECPNPDCPGRTGGDPYYEIAVAHGVARVPRGDCPRCLWALVQTRIRVTVQNAQPAEAPEMPVEPPPYDSQATSAGDGEVQDSRETNDPA